MPIKLVAVDLDGTLLNEHGELTPATKAAVRRASEKGITVAFCTGRTHAEARDIFALLPQVRYAVTTTCGRILDLHTQTRIGGVCLEADCARRIAEKLRACNACFALMADGCVYSDCTQISHVAASVPDAVLAHWNTCYTLVDDVYACLQERTEPIEKLFYVFSSPHERDAAWAAVQDEACFIACSGAKNLELTAVGADKGAGLRCLAEYLGIAREETCACGDNINDLEMLQYAGLAVAMGNATPDTKKHADVIAPSNREDGVAWVLDHLEELACN